VQRVDNAVAFAEASPFPAPETLYDDVYVLDPLISGRYSTTTTPPPAPSHPSELDGSEEIPHLITTALAAGEDASAGDRAPAGEDAA
jgi:hypothetical protein